MGIVFIERNADGDIIAALSGAPIGALGEWRDEADPVVIAARTPLLVEPAPPVAPSPRQWLERLAPETQLAIVTAAQGNAQLNLWLLKAAGNPAIDVTLQETKDGVAALVAAGVITAAEQTTLLAP
jgi:hypothetical protein